MGGDSRFLQGMSIGGLLLPFHTTHWKMCEVFCSVFSSELLLGYKEVFHLIQSYVLSIQPRVEKNIRKRILHFCSMS